jgi:hypothetical protein
VSFALPFDSDAAIARKWKTPGFAQGTGARRARRIDSFVRGVSQRETIGDPEEFSYFERWRQDRLKDFFGKDKRRPQDGCEGLPILPEDTASTLAARYGCNLERLQQALALHSYGRHGKARRLVLCGRIGKRINHQKHSDACGRKFLEPYFCREKYCTFCGPQQFKEMFAKFQSALTPIVEELLCDGAREGCPMVAAKLDFTVPNLGRMPTSQQVREFHDAMRRFWRVVERTLSVQRSQYGVARCDEIGGDNTNLHAHCAYVGPFLPQKNKELSALWSVVLLPKEQKARRRELMRSIKKDGLASLWSKLLPGEQRLVSIKLAEKGFSQALAHALQYPMKFIEKSDPQRLAALENTFHKTRRVSTGGAFYRIKHLKEPGDDRQFDHAFCPFCKVRLEQIREPWQPMSTLEAEGRISLRLAEREAGLQKALGRESPP